MFTCISKINLIRNKLSLKLNVRLNLNIRLKYMRLKMKLNFLLCTTLLSLSAHALEIDESTLVNWAKTSSFTKNQIEIAKLQAANEEKSFNENFIYNFGTEATYINTEEQPFTQFVPVQTPVRNFQVKLEKATKRGLKISTSAFSNQSTNNFIRRATSTGVTLSLSADLYKDLLGSLTKKRELSLSLQKKIANEEASINEKAFIAEVRKLYWSIIANNESIEIAKSLLRTSQKLEQDTLERFKSRVADKDELTRISSQVQARKGQIYLLEYERSNLLKQLRNLFPDQLNEQSITLKNYSIPNTVKDVLACSAKISASKQAPLEHTKYDEILTYLEADLAAQLAINEKHDDPEVNLIGEATYLGNDFGHSDSFDQLRNDGRAGVTVGLAVNIPLSDEKKDTQAVRKELITKGNISKYKEIQGKLSSFHIETVNSINVLYKVIAAQKKNTKLLNDTYVISNKKFKQARITAQNLLQDEDSLLQSNLNEIQTQYNVIATIIDYFSVYGDAPCKINL